MIIAALVLIIIGILYYYPPAKTEEFLNAPTSAEKIISDEKEKSDEQASDQCAFLPELPDLSDKLATKVIDGDTFIIEDGYSVRIVGIDADEKGYPCYQAAKDELEN